MTRALKNCESQNSHNLTSLFLTRATRVLQRLKVKQPNIAFTYNAPLSAFGFFLAWARMKICNGSDPEESLRATRWKNIRSPGAARRITFEFTFVNARRILLEKTQGKWTRGMWQDSCEAHFLWKKTRNLGAVSASHINLQSHWTQDTFYLRKHKGSGRVAVTRIFLGKRYGIWGGLAEVTYKFTVTLTARRVLPEKTQGIWGVGTTCTFLGKHKDLAG